MTFVEHRDGVYFMRQVGVNSAIHLFVILADTGIFVDIPVRSPPQQDLLGISGMAGYIEYMKIWNEVTSMKIEVRGISVEDADEAAPSGIGREAAESTATSTEFSWDKQLILPTEVSFG
jgi:hypothetical protein